MPDPTPASPDPSARQMKVAGIMQIVAGLVLIGLMGTITVRMGPMLLAGPEGLGDGSRFKASQDAARLVLALFGSVILVGVAALASGLRQVTTGRRSRPLVLLLWATIALVVVLTLVVLFALKQAQP